MARNTKEEDTRTHEKPKEQGQHIDEAREEYYKSRVAMVVSDKRVKKGKKPI